MLSVARVENDFLGELSLILFLRIINNSKNLYWL